MSAQVFRRSVPVGALLFFVFLLGVGGCRRRGDTAPPVATPSVTLSKDKVPLGAPIDITYKFVVAGDAHFTEDYLVMLHVLDADDQLIWTDDHNPPVPTSQWKPGQTVEYTRTIFVPPYPYVGEATLQGGLYSKTTKQRLPLSGADMGQRAYKVGRLQLQPQSESLNTMFKDGWYPVETADRNTAVDWQWSKKQATLSFRNPRRDAVLYLDLDAAPGVFPEPQQVRVSADGSVLEEFAVPAGKQLLKKLPVSAAQLGSGDVAEIQLVVDKTFVPANLPGNTSKDPRELGVRVFHAFIEPAR
jgi:hypothetical protein